MRDSKPAKSKALSPKLIYAAMTFLKEKGGELSGHEVIEEVEKRVHLDKWAKEQYKNGTIRWQVILSFMTLYATKVGFLIKNNGRWYLTLEGEQALKLGEKNFDQAVEDGYREWKLKNR